MYDKYSVINLKYIPYVFGFVCLHCFCLHCVYLYCCALFIVSCFSFMGEKTQICNVNFNPCYRQELPAAPTIKGDQCRTTYTSKLLDRNWWRHIISKTQTAGVNTLLCRVHIIYPSVNKFLIFYLFYVKRILQGSSTLNKTFEIVLEVPKLNLFCLAVDPRTTRA